MIRYPNQAAPYAQLDGYGSIHRDSRIPIHGPLTFEPRFGTVGSPSLRSGTIPSYQSGRFRPGRCVSYHILKMYKANGTELTPCLSVIRLIESSAGVIARKPKKRYVLVIMLELSLIISSRANRLGELMLLRLLCCHQLFV